jgi:ABC-2 type transport system ATP-binding protein
LIFNANILLIKRGGQVRTEGVTIIISSHDLRHVTEICNRVILLENGNIISDTNTSEETLTKLEEYFNV